jgi:peptidoglycan/LPS O-acetylase OafA/YrhL
MTHRQEIDGLRALAIIPVVLFHAKLPGFSGGFIGVDIFFVISGYLITGLLIRDIQHSHFSALNFYARRARRLLPALYVMLFTTTLVATCVMLPDELRSHGGALASVVGFGANVYFWKTLNYFSPAADQVPLLHTWSLSAEEQFYFVLPPVLIVLQRVFKLHGRSLLAVMTGATLISLAIGETLSNTKPQFAYFMLPARAWEMLAGGCLAIWEIQRTKTQAPLVASDALSLAGLVLLTGSIATLNSQVPMPGLWAVPAVVGTMLLLAFMREGGIVREVFCHRALVSVGLASYSIYLWHQPISAFAHLLNPHLHGPFASGTLAALSFALGFASYQWVESPTRNPAKFSLRRIWILSWGGFALLLGCGLVLQRDALNWSYRGAPKEEVAKLQMSGRETGGCFYNADGATSSEAPPPAVDGCHLGTSKQPPRLQVLLIGDSFAGHYDPFWDEVGQRYSLKVTSVSTNWCHPSRSDTFIGNPASPARDRCLKNRRFAIDHADRFDVVVVAGMWADVFNRGHLAEVADFIDAMAQNNRRVVVMPSPPLYDFDVARHHLRQRLMGTQTDAWQTQTGARDQRARDAYEALARQTRQAPEIRFLTREEVFGVDGACGLTRTASSVPISSDGNHLTGFAARQCGRLFNVRVLPSVPAAN